MGKKNVELEQFKDRVKETALGYFDTYEVKEFLEDLGIDPSGPMLSGSFLINISNLDLDTYIDDNGRWSVSTKLFNIVDDIIEESGLANCGDITVKEIK
jgi:hypothetical protein